MSEQSGRDKFLERIPDQFLEAPPQPNVPADFLEELRRANSQPLTDQNGK